MTKKHFIALADAVRDIERQLSDSAVSPADVGNYNDHETLVPVSTVRAIMRRELMALCRSEYSGNIGFKSDRWLNYIDGKCGPSGGQRK